MAIALDSFSQGPQSTATSWSWNHTCSGSNRLLLVMGHQTDTVNSVKYNNVSLTLAKAQSSGGTGMKIWYLIAPDTGTHSVAIASSSNTYIRYSSISYTGVNQDNPINATTGNTVNSTGITSTITTTKPNCWGSMIILGAGTVSGFTKVPSTNSYRGSIGGDGQVGLFDTNQALDLGGTSVGLTGGNSNWWSMAVVAIAPLNEPTTNYLKRYRRTRMPGNIASV